jgi:hypothetical protein
VELLTSDEFRLAYAVVLQVAALVGAWRFVRRRVGTDALDRIADVLLLNFLVQYLAVVIPGLVGVLNPLTIGLVTLALSAGLYFAPGGRPRDAIDHAELPGADFWGMLACALFAVGYAGACAWQQQFSPPMAQDALTYHYPAAVKWLQTHRLGLFETWFFNPANTYSPLAGSAYIAWWMAPMGNDVLARHVPVAALVLIFFAAVRLIRALGVRPIVAGMVALALVLSQPFLRQSIIEKDDLYLSAFFTCVVAGCAAERLRDPIGACRLGVALGLMLATKYTALLAVPALLLVADAPIRARWGVRRWGFFVGIALLVAGPWYLRNLLLTGNPLYPIDVKVFGVTVFKGLFESARSERLDGLGSMLDLLTRRDQSLPVWPAVIVSLAWVAAVVGRFRQLRGEPLVRACLLGPVVIIAVFWAVAPYAEIRFVFPGFVLLFAAAALAIVAWVRPAGLQVIAAAVVLVPAWATGFSFDIHGVLLPGESGEAPPPLVVGYVTMAVTVTLIGLAAAWVLRHFPAHRKRLAWGGIAATVLGLSAYVYVYWPAFVRTTETSCRAFWILPSHRSAHGELALAWEWVCKNLPPTEPLAYANTYLVHPMSGFDHTRPLLYVPTRRGVRHIHDLPHLPGKLSGERLESVFSAALAADPDPDGWLAKLKASGATHLFVAKPHPPAGTTRPPLGDATPPELEIIRAHPEKFEQVYENPAAVVYRVK